MKIAFIALSDYLILCNYYLKINYCIILTIYFLLLRTTYKIILLSRKFKFSCFTFEILPITARQYGSFVLADASAGQCPFTLASKLSRHKEAMARFLEPRHKLSDIYTCRGTMLLSKQEKVNLQ